jgi:hypothetical protein
LFDFCDLLFVWVLAFEIWDFILSGFAGLERYYGKKFSDR